MSDLSTADLAGGTTPRDRTTRETDTPANTMDADRDMRNDAFRSTDTDTADRDIGTRDEMSTGMPSGSSTMPRRGSTLPNPAATDGATSNSSAEPLFPSSESDGFRSRWMEVQTGFVDEPRNAVEQADGLVAEMMKRLATVFADERAKLEEQWSRGDDIGTEDLRQALRRYRSFFDRLLSV